MIVRIMEEKDIFEVQHMMMDLQNFHAEIAPEIFKKATLRDVSYYEKVLDDNNRIILIAIDKSNIPAGFIKGKIIDFPGTDMLKARKYGYVDGIFVKKPYRGQLVEYKLQKELFKWFKKQGVNHVEANVWDINERAKDYYQLFGYTYLKHGLEIDI